MSEVAAIDAGGDLVPERPVTALAQSSFLESLVARVCAECGGTREEVRDRAEELVRSYADARVQSFVPILVEKRLREICRNGRPNRTGGAGRTEPSEAGRWEQVGCRPHVRWCA